MFFILLKIFLKLISTIIKNHIFGLTENNSIAIDCGMLMKNACQLLVTDINKSQSGNVS